MSKLAGALRWAMCLALAGGVGLAGCSRPTRKPPAERVALNIYLPCVISSPLRKVINNYETGHPEVEIWDEKEKPLALAKAASVRQSRPALVITMGDVEMASLVRAGVVARDRVRDIGVNTYPMAVIVPAKGAERVRKLADLAEPWVKRVYLEDPAQSTLGDRAKRAFQERGLWDKVAPKLVQFDPDANVLDQLLDGKADAAVVFEDCLLEGGTPPKTIRVVGELPLGAYPPVTYQAAVISSAPKPEVAQAFVDYLISPGGREALQRAGLSPPAKP